MAGAFSTSTVQLKQSNAVFTSSIMFIWIKARFVGRIGNSGRLLDPAVTGAGKCTDDLLCHSLLCGVELAQIEVSAGCLDRRRRIEQPLGGPGLNCLVRDLEMGIVLGAPEPDAREPAFFIEERDQLGDSSLYHVVRVGIGSLVDRNIDCRTP